MHKFSIGQKVRIISAIDGFTQAIDYDAKKHLGKIGKISRSYGASDDSNGIEIEHLDMKPTSVDSLSFYEVTISGGEKLILDDSQLEVLL